MPRPPERLPEPPRSLDGEHAAELNAHTEAALLRQRRELTAALDKALKHIPLPLRGAVRRVLGL